MAVPVERVARILGLKPTVRSAAAMASAVESGLPKQSLARVAERAGFLGPARKELIHRVIAPATYKRRKRLKLTESEKTERLARVVALAELLWNEPSEAQRFLRTPHPELGRKRPIEAALTELGARQVEDIVMRALHGLPV
ncbi:MAG: antitoxin Xre/MbcA/ParS toxin-binding domain-containing protein [Gammaproteobacteria bacterium]